MAAIDRGVPRFDRKAMTLDSWLSPADADRAALTLDRLARHNVSGFALTGGLAIELQLTMHGALPLFRPLNDIDFLVDSFSQIPLSLADDLLLRHVHPCDPPGRILLQAVDPVTQVRIDVFRAYGNEMIRARRIALAGHALRVIAVEDLLACHARLCCDLLTSRPLAPKFARDFLRLLDRVAPGSGSAGLLTPARTSALSTLDPIWQEHRKPAHPGSFTDAVAALRTAIRERTDLLIPPICSNDVSEICRRCHVRVDFPLAPAQEIFMHLGYC